ncbi:MAG TPA: hypothetical protein DIT05_14015 [Morganella sp. (in: Bacteria)]|nr:hypothetical protein [Morganella sp. (in: enterobacteria)]
MGVLFLSGCQSRDQASENETVSDKASDKWGNCLVRYTVGKAAITADSKQVIVDDAYTTCKKEMNEAIEVLVADLSADKSVSEPMKQAARQKAVELLEVGYKNEIVPELYSAIDEIRKLN